MKTSLRPLHFLSKASHLTLRSLIKIRKSSLQKLQMPKFRPLLRPSKRKAKMPMVLVLALALVQAKSLRRAQLKKKSLHQLSKLKAHLYAQRKSLTKSQFCLKLLDSKPHLLRTTRKGTPLKQKQTI